MTYGHLQADCLYTGISSGPNAQCRVWEAFTFTFLYPRTVACLSTNRAGRIEELRCCDRRRYHYGKPRTERVQALADISRSALYCHSNETRATIANPANSAQLGGTPTIPQVTSAGQCSSAGMRRATDRHADSREHYIFRVVYDSRQM